MRNSYVDIFEHGDDKINHTYASRGSDITMKTLNENLNISVEDFMTVNFKFLPEVTDKLGGVKINIIQKEVFHTSGITSPGEQVLAYSRIRHVTGGDYKRTERQRVVLEVIFKKLELVSLKEYNLLIDKFSSDI